MPRLARRTRRRNSRASVAFRNDYAGFLNWRARRFIAVDDDQRIIVFNAGAEKIFGYPADEIVGQSIETLLPAVFAANHWKHAAVFGPDPSDKVRRISPRHRVIGRRRDGTEFRAEAAISEFSERGENCMAVVTDVTDRFQLEERLNQLQKLEAIGQLAGGIAHDFNNLLLVIIGNLDLLGEMMAPESPAQEMIKSSLTAALDGSELANGMLAFSRQQSLKQERVDLNAIVVEQAGLLKRVLGGRVTIETITADAACPTIADATLIRCVLTNLAVNARDAMPNGGTITMRTYETTLDASDVAGEDGLQPGNFVVIEVADTGVGISFENVQRIFDPFFTTKEVGKGTGLGLSMVYGFVKQSNGKISVTSDVGKGTTFKVFLPRAADAAAEENTKILNRPSAKKQKTILVVDDDAGVRKIVIAQLHALGYNTIEAGAAHESLDVIARGRPFDVLFTDIVMPGGIDGIQLARVARQKKKHLKILLTSGFPDLKMQHASEELGENVIIKKPYRRGELRRALRHVLGEPPEPIVTFSALD